MLFPEGKKKALTLSYDDGTVLDRRLVEIMNRCGVKGTFNLNAGTLDRGEAETDAGRVTRESVITLEEIPALYAGHEGRNTRFKAYVAGRLRQRGAI